MPVSSHHYQVGVQLLGITDNLFPGSSGVPYYRFHHNVLFFQLLYDFIQILLTCKKFRSGGKRSVHLAGDPFFDMQEVQLSVVLFRHGGGMGDRLSIPAGMIERDQDLLIEGTRQVCSDSLGKLNRRPAKSSDPGRKHGMEDDPSK